MSAPSRLGRYPVRRRIGAGAFATVWLAYDEQLDSPVAIKVLAENWTEDWHVRQRFLEEGRFLRKVDSPHVVTVYDAGELDDGRPFLVMSYADQGTLGDRLELSPLTTAQAVHVIGQVGSGLDALHRHGVLHRDVKPANVLFRSLPHNGADHGGQVVAMVGDLGLGKAMDMSSRLTMIGGTPSYVAPEQARGDSLDPRADQYSLAALAYLVLAGTAPYAHTSLGAAAEPGPPPPMGDDVSEEMEQVVARALAADPDERFPDVSAFVAALDDAAGELASPSTQVWLPRDPDLTQAGARPTLSPQGSSLPAPGTPPLSPRQRRRRRLVLGVGAPLAVLLGTLAGVGLEHATSTQRVLRDVDGTITVTVPDSWNQVDSRWKPVLPDSENEPVDQPALAAGTSADWQTATSGSGVFVGLLPGDRLPQEVPQHTACGTSRAPDIDERDGDESVQVVFTECPGGGIVVERVVQTTSNLLLWVQVRAPDRATANRVLDSVGVSGL